MCGTGLSFRKPLRVVGRLISVVVASAFICVSLPADAALPLGVYHNHANNASMIALTFDDGPHPRYTEEILDVLEEFGVMATFFFVGENVSYYPKAAREVARRGHEIGNHTDSHPCPIKQSEAALRRELSECERKIETVTGVTPRLFRPPTGSWNTRVYELAREREYDIILWDIDTMDWAHTPEDKIAAHVAQNIKSGDIILMHDYHTGGCTTTGALRQFLPELISRGFRFVTVSELIAAE